MASVKVPSGSLAAPVAGDGSPGASIVHSCGETWASLGYGGASTGSRRLPGDAAATCQAGCPTHAGQRPQNLV